MCLSVGSYSWRSTIARWRHVGNGKSGWYCQILCCWCGHNVICKVRRFSFHICLCLPLSMPFRDFCDSYTVPLKWLFYLRHWNTHTRIDTAVLRLFGFCLGFPGWPGTRTAKPVWILLKQETVSGSGISWAICKSLHLAPDKQPCQHPTTQFFAGQIPFLPPNQQCQSTEGTRHWNNWLYYIALHNTMHGIEFLGQHCTGCLFTFISTTK